MKEFGSNFEEIEIKCSGSGKELNNCDTNIFLRSARECLFLIGKKELQQGIHTVFIPSLCCVSMVQPFEQLGFNIVFYRINKTLKVDYEYLDSVLSTESILLLLNYYEIESFDIDRIKSIIGNKRVRVIQDCTQHIYTKSLYRLADYHVGSIRKWAAIPDGAFLMSEGCDDFLPDAEVEPSDPFVHESILAMKEKREYIDSGNIMMKESYRKRNSFCLAYLKNTVRPHQMSDVAKRIYSQDVDISSLREKRRENYAELVKALEKTHPDCLVYAGKRECPLCLPIIIANRNKVQKALADVNVYCQVLWPLPNKAKETCENSSSFANHMLAVPCDQRYSIDDMREIAHRIDAVLVKYA